MKKWLIVLAVSLAMLCLAGAALAVAPTMQDPPATIYKYCRNCYASGEAATSKWVINANTHTYSWRCSNCNGLWTMSNEPHNWHETKNVSAKDPTCTEIGWDAYSYCSLCYYHYDYNEKAALGHNMTSVNAKAATCTEVGWNAHKKCSRPGCTYKEGYTEISKLPHTGGEATCQHGKICSICSTEYTEIGDHDYSVLVSSSYEPNCYSPGYGTLQCKNCTKTTRGYYGKILGHDYGETTQEPTCTYRGVHCTNACRRCWAAGENNVTTWLDPLGHDYSGSAATCLTDQVCARENCNEVLVSALGHDIQQHEAQKPTCTEIGWNAYDTCKRENCDYTTYQELADLGGHVLTHHEAQKPTCTEIGWEAYDACDRADCDYTTYVEIPAMGHWYGAWMPCEDGMQAASCKRMDCEHSAETECTVYSAVLGEEELTVCPVCGKSDKTAFALIDGAEITGKRLPAGEAVVWGAESPVDGALYAFTVCYEWAGKPQSFPGAVTVTLPLENMGSFRLVRAEGESMTEIPFTLADGALTFETEAAGLFLLLPNE